MTNSIQAQRMNIGKSQADFRRSVSGMKKIGDKMVSVGLSRKAGAMDSLITTLKSEYKQQLSKKVPSDSLLLVSLERIAFCYEVHPSLDSRNYGDSILYYSRQKLLLARKVNEADMVVRSYNQILSQYRKDNVYDNRYINLVKAWVNDYETWIKELGVLNESDLPHLLLANYYLNLKDETTAEHYAQKVLEFAKQPLDVWYAHRWLGSYYFQDEQYDKAVQYLTKVVDTPLQTQSLSIANTIMSSYISIIKIYIDRQEYDKVLNILPELSMERHCKTCGTFYDKDILNNRMMIESDIYLRQKQPNKALPLLEKIVPWYESGIVNQKRYDPRYNLLWYDFYQQTGQFDKALIHLESYKIKQDSIGKKQVQSREIESKQVLGIIRSYETQLLNEKNEQQRLFQEQKFLSLKMETEINDIKTKAEKDILLKKAESADLQRQLETEELRTKSRIKQELQEKEIDALKIIELNQNLILQNRTRNFLFGGVLFLIVFLLSLLWSIFQLKKRNQAIQSLSKENIVKEQEKQQILSSQNETLEKQVRERTSALELSLKDLRETQAQLIQSEKMASLGELTAGIAHEIQNPLNFVNNFSEVSTELVDEMKHELAVGNQQLAMEIAADLKQNLEKINHHGKRAGDIVKGMLQHSRSSSGVKEPTNINALADEYLRLAYHGLRAKDKSFNATMKTDFDASIGNVNVIPQDIGRVILNLITNGFYVVNEKSKQGIVGYEPTVTVSTRKEGSKVLISVKDNGNGIPDRIKAKIFQPFFTTKPTGQGTGLGLSLSYDIVKAHGGELKAETRVGDGSEFIIQLPVV